MTSAQGAHDNVLRDAEERRRVNRTEAERDELAATLARVQAWCDETKKLTRNCHETIVAQGCADELLAVLKGKR